jgi:hypothetical protein
MKNNVFISGSISIKILPQEVKKSIDNIIEQNLEILIGDAKGIDALVQNYCLSLKYYNVMIYSIYNTPRYKASEKFKSKYVEVSDNIKRERERQQEKDKAMTLDSKFTFTIWDSKSKGSYANIIRAIENKNPNKIYLSNKNIFLNKNDITKDKIEFIYRENNGYTASEVIYYLKNEAKEIFKKTQDLNKYLLQKLVIKKYDKIYIPDNQYEDLFIVDKYHGKVKGIKFKNEFFSWIEKNISEERKLRQASLF